MIGDVLLLETIIPSDCDLFAETREAHALYQYAQTVDVTEVDMPTVDDSYSNVDCKLSVTTLTVQ